MVLEASEKGCAKGRAGFQSDYTNYLSGTQARDDDLKTFLKLEELPEAVETHLIEDEKVVYIGTKDSKDRPQKST